MALLLRELFQRWFSPRGRRSPNPLHGRRTSLRHRRLLAEPLEGRQMLAILGLDIELFEYDDGVKGDRIDQDSNPVHVGQDFFVSVTVEDQPDPQND